MHACDRTPRHRRPALLAAALLACALGSVPAAAHLPVGPEVTVPPWPITGGEGGSSPVPTTTTTTTPPPTTPTTSPSAPTSETTPAPASAPKPVSSAASGTTESSRPASRSRPRRPSTAGSAPVATLQVAPAADDAPTIARLRQLTLPTARQFGFPLGLALLVLAFVAVQGRLDARDPKLAFAPVSVDDDLLPFT